jgi:hypothetical protein
MPICAGCEQKVPYQELDTHQRYCRGRSADEDPSTSERLTAREAIFEEFLETMEWRFGGRDDAASDGRTLPTDLAGIEGSSIRYSRPKDER